MKLDGILGSRFVRSKALELRVDDAEGDELTFSFSSEAPVKRYWGTEVLLHEADSANLSRLNDGGAWLFNHNRDVLLGATQKAWIDPSDRRAYVTCKWSNREQVKPYRQDVQDDILRNVSFAYDILEWIPKDDSEEITGTKWEVFEVSLVTIPADPTVGIGRSVGHKPLIWGAERPVILQRSADDLNWECPDCGAMNEPIEPGEGVTEQCCACGVPKRGLFGPIVVGKSLEITGMEREELLQQERERARQIRAIGAEHGFGEMAQEYDEQGSSVEEFRAAVLEAFKEKHQKALAKTTPLLGLSKQDKDRYSVLKAMLASATGDWGKAGLEKECHEAILKLRGKEPGGKHSFYLPHFDLDINPEKASNGRAMLGKQQRTTYQVGTSNVGGVTVETSIYPEMIDYLRNVPLVMQFGAKMWTGLEGNLDVLKQLTYTTTGWIGEDDSLPESNATFGSFPIRPHDVGGWSRITRRMLQQSSVDIEMFVREELILGIALEYDRVTIHGSGIGNEPRGVLNTPGIGSVVLGANGGAPTWAAIVDLETQVATQNALMTNVAYVTTPRARGKLKTTLKAAAANSDFIWADTGIMTPSGNLGTLNGYLAGATNQLRSDLTKGSGTGLSAAVFGNWSEVICAFWDGLKVDMNPYGDTDFLKDAIKIKAIQTSDVQVGRPIAFAAITDMVTT